MDFDTSTHKARWIFDQDSLVGGGRRSGAPRGREVSGGGGTGPRVRAPRAARRALRARRPSSPRPQAATPRARSCRAPPPRPQAERREEAQIKAAESLKRSREPTPAAGAAAAAAADDGAAAPDAKKQRGAAGAPSGAWRQGSLALASGWAPPQRGVSHPKLAVRGPGVCVCRAAPAWLRMRAGAAPLRRPRPGRPPAAASAALTGPAAAPRAQPPTRRLPRRRRRCCGGISN
jgi:hypothetical protein